jgi:hypothetical protein
MENNTEENTQDVAKETKKVNLAITTPIAILAAGVFIMIGIIVYGFTIKNSQTAALPKSLSEQVGVSKDSLNTCMKASVATVDAIGQKITASVNNAMSALPQSQRGTPYSVVIGLNGVKTDIQGALPYDQTKKIIDDALVGKVTKPYKGNIDLPTADDHVFGNQNATVTVIEYSDFECPYCKQFHPTLKQIVNESNGSIRWIYRNYPLHQHSLEELMAAECIAKLKGNDAYWKYSDLLFGLQAAPTTVSDKL